MTRDPSLFTDPVHLTAIATVNPGAIASPNTLALQNPSGGPMEILEIKFLMQYNAGVASPLADGAHLGVELRLGDYSITNGFVPMWLFGRSIASFGNISLSANEYMSDEQSQTSQNNTYNVYNWKLPTPIYVPPGGVLAPRFQFRGQISFPITARISYGCRTLRGDYKPPKRYKLPWLAFYASKTFDVGGAKDTDASQEADLINPFDTPLELTQFVGRTTEFNVANSFNIDSFVPDFPSRLLQLTMADSRGNPVIKNLTSFGNAFSTVTKSWDVRGRLPPHQFYLVSLVKQAPPIQIPSTWYGIANIGMAGTREVS